MGNVVTTRLARADDGAEIARLLHLEDVRGFSLSSLGNHLVIVADAPGGGLAGVVMVRLDPPNLHPRLLAVASEYVGTAMDERLAATARTMAARYGCSTTTDVQHAA
ncbi:MAG: hypothetical protein M3680_04850 [Myxococcota bacterium]|nr:hypothetical protein [Myxococcota bacterium]